MGQEALRYFVGLPETCSNDGLQLLVVLAELWRRRRARHLLNVRVRELVDLLDIFVEQRARRDGMQER